MKAPWPVSILVIGDSYSQGGTPDWCEFMPGVMPGVGLVNEATSGKCLFDTGGLLGADTLQASIAADLVANPNADIVVWATSAANDVLRRKQILNTVTLGDLQTAATQVMAAIQVARKSLIVMAIPFVQAFINGFGAGDSASSTAANDIRVTFNSWLESECSRLGFIYYDPKWFYIFLGTEVQTGGNGIVAEFNFDGLHPNANGANRMAGEIGCLLRNNNWRIRARP